MSGTPTVQVPTLLLVIGPPAVGKMAVGQEIALRTGFRLFHAHLSIEPVLRFFDFGSPPFTRLVREFRRMVFAEVAASDLPGLIFTYVWAFDLPGDGDVLEEYAAPFRQRGGRVLYLELEASQQARLERNAGAFRLAEKPSKRDLQASEKNLLELDATYRLNSDGEFDGLADHLRIDNTQRTPQDVADEVVKEFGLSRLRLS